MKKHFYICLLVCLFCVWQTSAQKISKPTLVAKPPTAAQDLAIKQGIALHDKGRYDEAIEYYEQVLAENPDCAAAMYERALSYYNKGDIRKATEIALKGSEYKSSELPLFYGFLGNVLDDRNEPQKAIALYREGIKILEEEKSYAAGLSSLYYNLGVTHVRQKQYDESRRALKKSVENNFGYASPNYLLAVVFNQTNYKIPALLAAARLLSLELNTQRSRAAAAIFDDALRAGAAQVGKDKPNTINIFVDVNAPTDEGDFSSLSLILGFVNAGGTDGLEENKNKTAEELFASKVDSLIEFLATDKKTRSTFAGKNYFPFMLEMKKRDFVKIFSYLVLQQAGNREAEKWLAENRPKTQQFLVWAKSYKPL